MLSSYLLLCLVAACINTLKGELLSETMIVATVANVDRIGRSSTMERDQCEFNLKIYVIFSFHEHGKPDTINVTQAPHQSR